jgi:hypothetical protein
MVFVAQVLAVAAAVAFIVLYFTHLKLGDVLAAFLCLASAHRARGRVGGSAGVLGLDEVKHGNYIRKGAEMRANEGRDRRAALMKL